MSLVEFVIDKLDDLKGTEIVHFDVKGMKDFHQQG